MVIFKGRPKMREGRRLPIAQAFLLAALFLKQMEIGNEILSHLERGLHWENLSDR